MVARVGLEPTMTRLWTWRVTSYSTSLINILTQNYSFIKINFTQRPSQHWIKLILKYVLLFSTPTKPIFFPIIYTWLRMLHLPLQSVYYQFEPSTLREFFVELKFLLSMVRLHLSWFSISSIMPKSDISAILEGDDWESAKYRVNWVS